MPKSLYERQKKLGTLPKGVVRCEYCKGKGHVGMGECLNCDGAGGVRTEEVKSGPTD